MSISIHLHIYKSKDLIESLREWGANDNRLLRRIMRKFGNFVGGSYLLMNNEYGEESPYYNLTEVLDIAFGKDNSFRVIMDCKQTEGISYVNSDEVMKELGIPNREWIDAE